ncbi:MAG: hypothetical protein ACTSVV_04525 [Promethearchaeota archaeon]
MDNIVHLEKFYNALKESFIKNKRKKLKNSLFLTIIETKGSTRFNILENAGISSIEVDSKTKNELLSNKLIRESAKKFGEHIITGNGVWQYELKNNIISEDKMIKYVDDKYFNIYKKVSKKLDDFEKSIILGLIAARSFSKQSLINCNKDSSVLDRWQDIFNRSFSLLKDLRIIKSKNEKLFDKSSGNQHIIAKAIRAKSKLFEKVNNIYKNGDEKNSRFLKIYFNNKFHPQNLIFLLKKVFERKLEYNEIIKVSDFCNKISEKNNLYLFDYKTHLFKDIDYDDKIKDCLFKL